MPKSSICFLFGSGISVHAGMPSMKELSNELLSGEKIICTQHGAFAPFEANNPQHTIRGMDLRSGIREILPLISALKAEADIHYEGWVSSNYEDWFYLADQLGKGSIEYDNPACSAFREILKPRIERKHPLSGHTRTIDQLADQACKYISDWVWLRLSAPPSESVNLDWIIDAVRDSACENEGLFTLNNDLLLEGVFERHGLSYTVGFEKEVAGSPMRHWDEDAIASKSQKTIIAKLHGSVDWRENNNLGEFLRNDQRKMAAFRKGPSDQAPEDSRLMMLIGRHNKLFQYSSYVYDALQFAFHRALKASKTLVVCGYGWGDKGINTKILNWRFAHPRKLVVIRPDHPFPEGARTAITQGFVNWQEDERFVHVPARAEEVNWAALKTQVAL